MTTGAEGAGAQGGQAAGAQGGAAGAQGAGAQGGQTGIPAGPAWLPGADPDTVAYVASKGWDKASNPAESILTSYRHLEKLFGADKAGQTVQLPGDGADQKTLDAFFTRIGRPETVDKYGVKPSDITGMSEDTAKGLVDLAFKEGFTTKQLNAVKEWNNATAKTLQDKMNADAVIERGQQEGKLKTEWGAAHDQNIQIAKEAAQKLGWSKEQIDAMQIGLGYDGVMKLALSLGVKVGEGQFIQGQGGRSAGGEGVMTPQQAQQSLNKLVSDKDFMAAWSDKNHIGHKDAVAKKSQLAAWAAAA